MRTHGHREVNITHQGLWRGGGIRGGIAEGELGGDWGGITLGEMPEIDDGGMDAGNHQGTCIPM